MKSIIAICICICFISCSSQNAIVKEGSTVFRSVNVVSMENDQVVMNQDVVVSDGKIVSVNNSEKNTYPENVTVIEGSGKFLMPGLAEMHAHVPPIDDIEPMKEVLMLFASYGITTIRGMLGHPKHLELRQKVNSGEITGPHFFTSGPSFSGQSVTSPEQGAAMVKEQKDAGYDFLKIHPGLTPENFDAVAKASKRHNIPFAGHVSFHVGVWKAIDAGQQTIDHMDAFVEGLVPGIENMTEQQTGFFGLYAADKIDSTKIPKLMSALKEKKVWVVPTQALAERWMTSANTAEHFRSQPEMKYMDEKTLGNWMNMKQNMAKDERYDSAKVAQYIQLRRKLIYECNKAGVDLLLGCDAPQVFNVPGISTHQELQLLVDAGLTPYEAIKTGTVNVARFYNQTGKSGVIKAGAAADMVLVNGNPLENIANTQKIEGVMLKNKWFDRSALDANLKKLEKTPG